MSGESALPPLKRFKKIPVFVVEEHNDALQFIYAAIGGKRLPMSGTTLLHLDAHPDMLIDRKLKGEDARSDRKVLSFLNIENWILPAVAAEYLGRVVWLRPPWAKQFTDGSRDIRIGDHPDTGLLRVDSTEPYFMSDALFSSQLLNDTKFNFTTAELNHDPNKESDQIQTLQKHLDVREPYVLDIDLDFFSTGNPFLSLYENINLYDRLEPIFSFELPEKYDTETVAKVTEKRELHIQELESLFLHLELHGNLEGYEGEKTDLFKMVAELVPDVDAEADRLGETPDWWAIYAGGCTRDQGGLPYHISTEEEIRTMIEKALNPLLRALPRPVMITVSRSTDDGYCPPDQVDFIQDLVLATLKDIYDTDDPAMYYLAVNTG